MTKILILSATGRSNMQLSQQIQEQAQKLDIEAEIIDLESLGLPLYTVDQEAEGIPKEAVDLTEKLIQVAGFVFVCPEYNGGLTPASVNALNWISRTGGDWRQCFSEKMVLMATSSGGGGQNLLRVMNTQLQHLGAIVLPRSVVVNSSKKFSEQAAQAGLRLIKRWSGAPQ